MAVVEITHQISQKTDLIKTIKKFLDNEIECGIFEDLQKNPDTVNHKTILGK